MEAGKENFYADIFPFSLLKVFFLSLLSALQSVFIVPTSACHVNFDGVLEEGDGPTASEDSLAFSEDSLSSSSSFLHFRSAQVLSAHLLHAHPNLVLFYNHYRHHHHRHCCSLACILLLKVFLQHFVRVNCRKESKPPMHGQGFYL